MEEIRRTEAQARISDEYKELNDEDRRQLFKAQRKKIARARWFRGG